MSASDRRFTPCGMWQTITTNGRALLRLPAPNEAGTAQSGAATPVWTVERAFTLRTADGFVENFGPALLATVGSEAPRIRLNFLQKLDKDSAPLREGKVDLETAVIEPTMGPELRAQALFRDRLIGAISASHPLAGGPINERAYSEARHVIISRSGFDEDAVERPYLPTGVSRHVASAVSGFSTALSIARNSDLMATVPELHTSGLRGNLVSFPLPFRTIDFTVSMVWHPRLDADPVHRWLRTCLRSVCAQSG